MTDKPEIDIEAMKRLLDVRREELEELIDAGAATRSETDLAQQREGRLARMDALQRQAVDQNTARRRKNELSRVNAALARIEEGNYGWCTSCDGAIAPRRLANDPAAALCIECARRAG